MRTPQPSGPRPGSGFWGGMEASEADVQCQLVRARSAVRPVAGSGWLLGIGASCRSGGKMNPLTEHLVGREFGVRYGVRQRPQRSLPLRPVRDHCLP